MKRNMFVSFFVTLLLALGLSFVLLPPVKVQAKVRLNKTATRVMVGNKVKLKVLGTKKKVKWSSANNNVATVSKKGKVTAVGRGNTVITAKVGKKTLTCSIEVFVPSLTLDKTSLEMYVGENSTLKAKMDPPESPVEWSSNKPEVVTVSGGVVTAKRTGEATVTVKSTQYGFTAECTVKVVAQSLTLDSEAISLLKGQEYKLTATTVPSGNTVTWTSSDENVATVSSEGAVKAINNGTAKITAQSMGLEKICTVTVTDKIPIVDVVLDKETITLSPGESEMLEATVLPEFTTEDKTVNWKTSDIKVAKVVNGKVTAIMEGTATITATAGTHSAKCSVTVLKESEDPAIKLDKESLTLTVKETAQLKATLSPDLSGQTVTWTSTDKKIASVDENGKVTAVSKGSAKIIAMAGAHFAYCDVTVLKEPAIVGMKKIADKIEEHGELDESDHYYIKNTDSSGVVYEIVEMYSNEFLFKFSDANATYAEIKKDADMKVSTDDECLINCYYKAENNAGFKGTGFIDKNTFKATDKINFEFSDMDKYTVVMAQPVADATVKFAMELWEKLLETAGVTYSDLGFKSIAK